MPTPEFMLSPVDDNEDLILKDENPEIYAHLENVLVHMIYTQDVAIFKSQKDYVRNNKNFWNIYVVRRRGRLAPRQPLSVCTLLPAYEENRHLRPLGNLSHRLRRPR